MGSARGTAGRFETWFLLLGAGWALLGWWGVVIAEAGQFTPRVLLLPPALAALAAALAVRRHRRESVADEAGRDGGPGSSGTDPSTGRRSALAVDGPAGLALLTTSVICFLLFFPPFDVRLEARDPGTYLLAGQHLARTGTLTWNDDTVTRLGPQARAYLFPSARPERAFDSTRFLGFYLERADTGRVVPQAAPLYPVWVAVGTWIAGTSGGGAVAGVLLWLAACGLSLLAAALFGRWGLAAGPLLASGVISGWFARYSAAEAAAQLLIVLGTLALVRYRQRGTRLHGFVAAVAFGLCPLTKAELLVVLLPLTGLLLADVVVGRLRRRDLAVFWGPLALLALHTLVHAIGWLWPYYFDILRQFRLTPLTFTVGAVTAAALASTLLLVAQRATRGRHAAVAAFLAGQTRAGRALRWALAGTVVALTAAGYWVRPALYAAGQAVDSWNMANHVELGLGISPALVFLAAVGMALVLLQRDGVPGELAVAGILMVLSALILWERNIIPRPMWAFRRWLPVLLPASYLFGMVTVARVAEAAARRRRWLGSVGVLLLAPVVWHHATAATWIKRHVELPGAAAAIEELAEGFAPQDAVVFESRTRRGLVRFEAVLGLETGGAVYPLPGPTADTRVLREIAWERAQHGGALYLVTTGYLNGLPGIGAEPVREFLFDSEVLEEFYDYEEVLAGRPLRLPRVEVPLRVSARIYRLHPEGRLAPLPRRVVGGELRGELDVGLWDEPYLVGELVHQTEVAGFRNFRWTTSRAVFLLPAVPAELDAVVLRIHGNELLRQPQYIEAWLDGHPLGSQPVPEIWDDVRFAPPRGWAPTPGGIARLEIRVPAVVPQQQNPGAAEGRELGVRVDRVFWARAQGRAER